MMITKHGLFNCLQLSFSYETAVHSLQWFLANICKYFWTFDATQNTLEHSIISSPYTIWLSCSISIPCLSNWQHNFIFTLYFEAISFPTLKAFMHYTLLWDIMKKVPYSSCQNVVATISVLELCHITRVMLQIKAHSDYYCSCAGVCVHASDTWNDSCQLCADCFFNGFKYLHCIAS